MKTVSKLLKNRKSSKLSTAAKIAVPVAGIIAAKHLWDKKGAAALEKVLEKTEDLQEKVQKFHDFVQNSVDKSAEDVVVDEIVEENEDIFAEEETGEETDVVNEEDVEEVEENHEEAAAETEESEKKSETD